MSKASEAKKLVLVLATSTLMTDASKEAQVTQVTQNGKKSDLKSSPIYLLPGSVLKRQRGNHLSPNQFPQWGHCDNPRLC